METFDRRKIGEVLESVVSEILKRYGFFVIKSSGSGRQKLPDIVAVKNGVTYAIECRFSSRPHIFIQRQRIIEWLKQSSIHGFKLRLAVMMKYLPKIFIIPIEKLNIDNNVNYVYIYSSTAVKIGVPIDEWAKNPF